MAMMIGANRILRGSDGDTNDDNMVMIMTGENDNTDVVEMTAAT